MIDKKLLVKFFKGACTEEEVHIVLQWLSDPKNEIWAHQVMEYHWTTLQTSDTDTDLDVDKLLAKAHQEIDRDNPGIISDQQATPPAKQKWFSWRIAAVWVAILVTLSSILLLLQDQRDAPFLVDQKASRESTGDLVEVTSASGQIVERVLPDGTKVLLNAQSSLSFPVSFTGRPTREVVLSGEAFFDVAEDKQHPLIVKTKGVNIVVLGTAFNLKSYDGDPTVETTLIRGRLVVEKNTGKLQEKVELKPSQRAIFSHATKSLTLVDVKIKEPTDWNNRSLRFEDARFYDVIKSLERWYGVTIHLEDESDLNCRLTARIDKESLKETLEILKSLIGIDYSIEEQNVFIKGKICEQ